VLPLAISAPSDSLGRMDDPREQGGFRDSRVGVRFFREVYDGCSPANWCSSDATLPVRCNGACLAVIREAGEALTQVTKIYNNTASNVPPGLPPVLVFGAAYISRDAEAARAWWKRSQDAKPKCFDTEFGSPPVDFTGSMVIWMTRIRPCRKPTYSHKSCSTRVPTNLSGIAVPYCAMSLTKCRRLPDEDALLFNG
jgi:hypothetical protein